MRMRKKKNLDVRFAACADVMAFEPKEQRGRWRALFGNDHPLHVEIGCGKGRFAIGMAEQHQLYRGRTGGGRAHYGGGALPAAPAAQPAVRIL